LDVEEQDVDAIEHRGAGMTRGTVEAIDRQARLRIDRRCNRGSRAAIAAETVLGRVDRFEPDRTVPPDRVDDRFELRRDAAGIGNDADAASVQIVPRLAKKGFVAQFDARRRYRLGARARGRGEGKAGGAG
jgi:hypothetical protein